MRLLARIRWGRLLVAAVAVGGLCQLLELLEFLAFTHVKDLLKYRHGERES